MRPSERLLLWLVVGAAALTVDKIVIADCRLTSTATIPVNDLGRRSYNGVVGGLYPNGTNNPSPAHLNAGINIATNQIKPLNNTGAVDLARGRIVFISVGIFHIRIAGELGLGEESATGDC